MARTTELTGERICAAVIRGHLSSSDAMMRGPVTCAGMRTVTSLQAARETMEVVRGVKAALMMSTGIHGPSAVHTGVTAVATTGLGERLVQSKTGALMRMMSRSCVCTAGG